LGGGGGGGFLGWGMMCWGRGENFRKELNN